ncbi:hypothetical protein HDU80_011295 [Chytriomyces hyalinus]|nr:hypothetical protein HDU80_011295 [Chytriomyces hyalinus]
MDSAFSSQEFNIVIVTKSNSMPASPRSSRDMGLYSPFQDPTDIESLYSIQEMNTTNRFGKFVSKLKALTAHWSHHHA